MELNINDTAKKIAPTKRPKVRKPLFRKRISKGQKLKPSSTTKNSINVRVDKSSTSNKFKKLFSKGNIRKFALALVILVLGYIGLEGYRIYKKVQKAAGTIGVEVSAGDLVNTIVKEEYEFKKDESGVNTNVLLVGIDTRENNKGLQNTDTIIVASYNHNSQESVMISIPRDTYIEYPIDSGHFMRINAVYNSAENREEGSGLKELQAVVEEFVGLDIQYYLMIDYMGFQKVVDAIGGITVNVENTFTDYMYPTGRTVPPIYETIHFDAGPQNMDGETALKYARSRKSQQNGEGSDYARARRQQRVINAIKDKILSTETLLNPEAIMGLITAAEENIKVSEITLQDIKAGVDLGKELGDPTVYSFVYDPFVGNRKVIKADDATYLILPFLGMGNHEGVNEFTQQLITNPSLYSEDATVYVYDVGIGYYPALQKVRDLQAKYPYLSVVYGGTKNNSQIGDYVFLNSDEEDFSTTIEFFANELETENTTRPEFATANFIGVDVVIMLGAEPVMEETDATADEAVVQ